ncbi:MAG: hypothetical protein HWN68_15040 [Desulfobacterales bacterium]|nr:hypothetical protein [Desulfobacterales bacterium]
MSKPTDEYYVSYVKDRQKEADDAVKPLRQQWKELWQLYQNKQDWSKKLSWQSKCFIPKIFMLIEAVSAEIKKAVIQPKKLFKFELDDSEEQEAISRINEQIIEIDGNDPGAAEMIGELKTQIQRIEDRIEIRRKRMVQREKVFKKELLKSNLANIYSLMIKTAFLLGIGVPKVLWNSKKKRVKLENVDMFNFSIDPTFMPFQEDRPNYSIERQVMPLARLRKLAKENGSKYRKSEIKKVEDDVKKLEKEAEENRRRGLGQHGRAIRQVEILQFWGDVIHEDDKIEENVLLITANGKYLIRKQNNPFRHELPPYIPTMPIPYPHRGQAGISLVQPMAKLQYAYNNIINMWIDNLNFTVNKAFTFDPNKLQSPKEMTAIYPGKKIAVNSENAVQEVEVSPLKRDSLMVLNQLDREMQEGTRVTESVSGMGSKKKKTLGEIELNTVQSKSLFEVIGRDIEQNSLKQVLEMSYDLYSQFKGWEKREGNYNFIVGGLSLIITQQQLTERVGQALGMAIQAPDVLGQLTDIQDLWRRFLTIFNLQDAYKEPDSHVQQLRPDQIQAVQGKAEQDAKQTVLRMSPEQIRQAV